MTLWVALAALAACAVGGILRQLIFLRWPLIRLYTQSAVFPTMCPVCGSPEATVRVEEKTTTRQTGYYVVAQRLAWWKVPVPYCADCARALSRNQIIGLVLGGACIVGVFLIAPPAEYTYATLCYILFGYPAYAVATTIQKGIVFGRATATAMTVHVKLPAYFWMLEELNKARPAKL
ncbi:MAG: hypothetical protein ABSG65_35770 [Bryobacteraceae bacterium]|jgi:hypothetical protein